MPTKKQLEAADKALKEAESHLGSLSEDEIEAAATADHDNPPLTDAELKKAWRVKPVNKTAAE